MLARRLASPVAAAARLLSAAAPEAGGAGRGDTLGKRLLKLIYPKRSAVVVLRRWAEEGRTVQKYQLNRVVRELRKYGRFKHALEVYAACAPTATNHLSASFAVAAPALPAVTLWATRPPPARRIAGVTPVPDATHPRAENADLRVDADPAGDAPRPR